MKIASKIWEDENRSFVLCIPKDIVIQMDFEKGERIFWDVIKNGKKKKIEIIKEEDLDDE